MAEIEHFSGSVVKKLEDGTTVLSSYVDTDNGETLVAGAGQSEKVEAASGNEEETEAARKTLAATQPKDDGKDDGKQGAAKQGDAKQGDAKPAAQGTQSK